MLAQWTAQLVRESPLPAPARDGLLAAHGVSMAELAAPGATILHDTACALWEGLAPADPPGFGVRFAERFDVRGLGLLGYLAAASSTLGDMLTRVVRFHDLVKRPPTAALTRQRQTFTVVETAPPGARPWPGALAESILGAYLSASRKLTGASLAAVRVRFQHAGPARPEAPGEVERFFRCAVTYSAPVNELVLPAAAWDLPILSADPTLLGLLEVLAGQRTEQRDLDRLRTLLAQALTTGRCPTLQEAARQLGVGPRTLQRRLRGERGLSFRALVDEVRGEAAGRLLADGRVTLEEVAYLLGFSDAGALRKARRRWAAGCRRRTDL